MLFAPAGNVTLLLYTIWLWHSNCSCEKSKRLLKYIDIMAQCFAGRQNQGVIVVGNTFLLIIIVSCTL